MSDHEADAWDQLRFHPELEEDYASTYYHKPWSKLPNFEVDLEAKRVYRKPWDDHVTDSFVYTRVADKFLTAHRYEDYIKANESQPEFQQLHVVELLGETEKSYKVNGHVNFAFPYLQFKSVSFDYIWLPKSQCLFTGNHARVPHWIISARAFRKYNGKFYVSRLANFT